MRLVSLVAASAAALVALQAPALAHGGAYQSPPPEPPPPPPKDPPPPRPGGNPGKGHTPPGGGGGGGPTTGGGPAVGPTTGGGDGGGGPPGGDTSGGPSTPSGPGAGPGGAPTGGPTVGPTTGGPTQPPSRKIARQGPDPDHWTRWWYGHRESILGADFRARNNASAVTAGNREAEAAKEALARAEVQRALAGALSDKDEDVASGAAVALGRGADPADASLLLDVLRDRSRQTSVREAAALGLGLIPADPSEGSSTATRSLLALASDEPEPTRLRAIAVWSLGLRKDTAALPFLREMARDPRADDDVAAAAVSALGLSACAFAREDLEAILDGRISGKKPAEKRRRVHAAHGLAHLGDPAAIPALVAATREDDEDVRRAAILALGALVRPDGGDGDGDAGEPPDDREADREAVQRLLHLLERDRDRACRNVAAISLGRIGSRRAGGSLRYAYEKGDSLHQPFAALALGLWCRRNGDASLMAPLRRDLRDRANPDLRGALSIALGLARDRSSVGTLVEIVEDRGDPELLAHAAAGIGMTGDPAGAAPLRKALDATNDPAMQRETALALGLLGDVQAVRMLAKLVQEDGSLFVQGAAAVSLGRIGGDDTCSVLRDLLSDRSRPDLARAFAAVGLGRLLDRTQGRGLARVGQDLDWYRLSPSATEILTIL